MKTQQNAGASNSEERAEDWEHTNLSLPDCDSEFVPQSFVVLARRLVAMARPHHYGKNILVPVGFILAGIHRPDAVTMHSLLLLGRGLLATCLIASCNYILNEILDAASDRHHIQKRHRPMAAGTVSRRIALIAWFALGTLGLLIAATVGQSFLLGASAFMGMAVMYNVPPFRLKNIPYVDVLSEALNSPIRFMLGWLVVMPFESPGLWILLSFWMAGAFVMARKRLIEYRFLDSATIAARYRASFIYYNESRLKQNMALYAIGGIVSAIGAALL